MAFLLYMPSCPLAYQLSPRRCRIIMDFSLPYFFLSFLSFSAGIPLLIVFLWAILIVSSASASSSPVGAAAAAAAGGGGGRDSGIVVRSMKTSSGTAVAAAVAEKLRQLPEAANKGATVAVAAATASGFSQSTNETEVREVFFSHRLGEGLDALL